MSDDEIENAQLLIDFINGNTELDDTNLYAQLNRKILAQRDAKQLERASKKRSE